MFAPGFFAKSYFPGSYFPPIEISSPACQLARDTLIEFGFDRAAARAYLIGRAADHRVYGGVSSVGYHDRASRRGQARLYTEAALCIDATLDTAVLVGLVDALRITP